MKKMSILIIPISLWAIFFFWVQEDPKDIADTLPDEKKEIISKRWGRSISSDERSLKGDPRERENLVKQKERLRKIRGLDKSLFPEDYKLEHKGTFLISDQVRAAPLKNYNALLGRELFREKGFVYYKVPRLSEDNLMNSSFNVLPVVMNTNTGVLGVVTGNMVVKLKEGEELDHVVDGHDVELLYSSKHIRSYVIQCHKNDDLREFQQMVSERDGVSTVELEIIQHSVHAK